MGTSNSTPTDDRLTEVARPRHPSQRTDEDERAIELVLTMAALPPSDPARAGLRDRAIEAWLPMAHRLAYRYTRRGETSDDLQQVATVGLIKAVDRFDPQRGTDFIGYAIPTIVGEIKRYFRDRTWAVRVPRRLQEMRLVIGQAQTELSTRMQRSPTVADIAVHLQVSEEEVLEGLEGGYAYRALSLSTPLGTEPGLELVDTLGSCDHGYELVELNVSLPPALACLTDRERQIIAMRFYGNQTQAAIAEQIGVSQMHVSRLLSGALGKLRKRLGEAG
jgi:RNA polymerase sigma-B factor